MDNSSEKPKTIKEATQQKQEGVKQEEMAKVGMEQEGLEEFKK